MEKVKDSRSNEYAQNTLKDTIIKHSKNWSIPMPRYNDHSLKKLQINLYKIILKWNINTKTCLVTMYLKNYYKKHPHSIKTSVNVQKCPHFNKVCFRLPFSRYNMFVLLQLHDKMFILTNTIKSCGKTKALLI